MHQMQYPRMEWKMDGIDTTIFRQTVNILKR